MISAHFPHKRQFFCAEDGQDYCTDRLILFMRYEWKWNWENRTSEIEVLSDCFVIEAHFTAFYGAEFGLGSFFKDAVCFFFSCRPWLKNNAQVFVLFKLPMALTLTSNNSLNSGTAYNEKLPAESFALFSAMKKEEEKEIQSRICLCGNLCITLKYNLKGK